MAAEGAAKRGLTPADAAARAREWVLCARSATVAVGGEVRLNSPLLPGVGVVDCAAVWIALSKTLWVYILSTVRASSVLYEYSTWNVGHPPLKLSSCQNATAIVALVSVLIISWLSP